MMRYVFGPVPSRRLGQFLGVDPIPLKTCNWNCIYCQIGRSVPMRNERREYFPREAILANVHWELQRHQPGDIDWISFVGSGEPTLHSELGWLIREIKKMSRLPIVVCTNGALLHLPEARQDLLAADAVMPTVAAGSAELFREIHRPYPGLEFDRFVDGLLAFRQEYSGQLWAEAMLIKGLNDNEPALRDLAHLMSRIQPDHIHIATPTRPPVETWVQPPDREALEMATAILGDAAQLLPPEEGDYRFNDKAAGEAILAILTRYPIRQSDLERSLANYAPEKINEALESLANAGEAQLVERNGARYWRAAAAHFPDRRQSDLTAPAQRRGGRSKYQHLWRRENS